MLERASAVEQAEQERADGAAIALLMPSKAGDNTVTIALMLDFEHHALVGFVGPSSGFGHYAIKAGAFKTPKPIGGPTCIDGCRRHMNGGSGGGEQRFENTAATFEGLSAQIPATLAEHVEKHHRRRVRLSQKTHTRG